MKSCLLAVATLSHKSWDGCADGIDVSWPGRHRQRQPRGHLAGRAPRGRMHNEAHGGAPRTADACIVGEKQTVLDAKLKNGDWLQAVLMTEDDKIHAMVEDRKLGIKSSFAEFEGAYVLVSEERSGDYTPAHRAMTEKHTFWGPWLPATVVGGDLPKIFQKKWGGPGWLHFGEKKASRALLRAPEAFWPVLLSLPG